MPNRTEMLHFRATPEEKTRIKENAGHAEVALSEWMRKRSLSAFEEGVRSAITQPDPLGRKAMKRELEGAHVDRIHFDEAPETYEQFMERRVPELCGENPSVAEVGDAEIAARAEWAER
jgi:hypothetical protein